MTKTPNETAECWKRFGEVVALSVEEFSRELERAIRAVSKFSVTHCLVE